MPRSRTSLLLCMACRPTSSFRSPLVVEQEVPNQLLELLVFPP